MLDELRKFLEKQKDGKGYLETLDAHLKSLADATKADKATIKKLQDEAKANKEKLDAASSKIEKFADALGVSEDSDTLDDDIAAALKTKGGNGDPSLQRKVDRLTRQLADKTKELTDQLNSERSKRHEAMITSALVKELTDAKAIEPATLVDMFRKNIRVNDDDTLTYGENGTIKDGVTAWLKDHPRFVNNDQKAGAGGAGGSGSGGGDSDDKFIAMAKSLGAANKPPKDDPAAQFFK